MSDGRRAAYQGEVSRRGIVALDVECALMRQTRTDKSLSGLLIVRDEEAMIEGALRSLGFCDEIVVVVDDRTVDRTEQVVRDYADTVVRVTFSSFDQLRNAGIAHCRGEWLVFCDADERVTPRLANELQQVISAGTELWAFSAPRVNFFWGRQMRHGRWPESPVKIVRRARAMYVQPVHEQLQIPAARIGHLSGEWWHFSHRSISEDLSKTITYGELFAADRNRQGAKPVRARTLVWVLMRMFVYRCLLGRAWLDGMPGVIEGVFQPFAQFCQWVMLWEIQQHDKHQEIYAALEEAVYDQV